MTPDYKAFAQWAIREGAWDGCDLDGAAIQSRAVEFGIVKQVPYDPAIHGESEFAKFHGLRFEKVRL